MDKMQEAFEEKNNVSGAVFNVDLQMYLIPGPGNPIEATVNPMWDDFRNGFKAGAALITKERDEALDALLDIVWEVKTTHQMGTPLKRKIEKALAPYTRIEQECGSCGGSGTHEHRQFRHGVQLSDCPDCQGGKVKSWGRK